MRAAILSYPDGYSLGKSGWNPHILLFLGLPPFPTERWSRWERIGGQLGSDWIGLMNPRDIPADIQVGLLSRNLHRGTD